MAPTMAPTMAPPKCLVSPLVLGYLDVSWTWTWHDLCSNASVYWMVVDGCYFLYPLLDKPLAPNHRGGNSTTAEGIFPVARAHASPSRRGPKHTLDDPNTLWTEFI